MLVDLDRIYAGDMNTTVRARNNFVCCVLFDGLGLMSCFEFALDAFIE